MTAELRRAVPLTILFVVGLAAGIWVFVSPWALAYPTPHGWTPSTWSSVWVGGFLAAASAVSLVTVLARALHLVMRTGTSEP
jgi:hypothetical protein